MDNWFWKYGGITLAGALWSIVAAFMLLISLAVGSTWYGCQVEAEIYNQTYNTQYTTAQFFWAGSTIKDYIQPGEQKTFNVNI